MTDPRRSEPGKSPRRWISPGAIGPLILAVIALLLVVGLVLFGREQPPERAPRQAGFEEEREAAPIEELAVEQRCASQAVHDLIKRELFRRAGAIRGSNQRAFEQLPAYSLLRVSSPAVTQQDEGLGLVGCRAAMVLDLPPGVAVAGGRRSLGAEIGYSLQSTPGGGTEVTITGAEAIVIPLSTLARVARPADDPLQPTDPGAVVPGEAPPPVPPASPEPEVSGVAPSFSCRFARTRGEIAVCGNPELAALDRQTAALYSRSFGQANARQRELLEQTRNRFLAYRDACSSDRCIADAYRGRMREIADILAGRWSLTR